MSNSLHLRTLIKRLLTLFIAICLIASPAISKPVTASSISGAHWQKPKSSRQTQKSRPQKPAIKEVPKSRKQAKPAVVKPKAKPAAKPAKAVHSRAKKH